MSDKTTVLFRDYNAVWCPLSDLYWSLQSLSLLSRHPNSTVEEIVSNYCPQCLSRYTEDEVLASSGCCPACQLCPCCDAVLIADQPNGLVCGLCFWHSNDSEGMQRGHTDSTKIEAFSLIQTNIKSICLKSSESSGQPGKLQNRSKVWQLEELKLKLENLVDEETVSDASFMHRLGEVCKRSALHTAGPEPANVPLLTKKALRSRQDARSGRMNILMQPKTLPLEGDSSLKLQKGKWWVKDSSAIQDLPFVSIMSYPTPADLQQGPAPCILVLCLTNPKVSDITVSFRADTVSPGAADYMRYRSGTGQGQWVRSSESDGNHVCLQVSRELGPVGGDRETLDILIGAFEDELLKDASDVVAAAGETAAQKLHHAPDPSKTSAQQWTYRVEHNKAFVYIPVSISGNMGCSDLEGCSFEVNLQCRLNLGGAATIDLPFKVIFS